MLMSSNWILDMETWFSFTELEDKDKVPFALLKLLGIAKMIVLEHNFKSWDALVSFLGNTFYSPNYRLDLQAQWIHLH